MNVQNRKNSKMNGKARSTLELLDLESIKADNMKYQEVSGYSPQKSPLASINEIRLNNYKRLLSPPGVGMGLSLVGEEEEKEAEKAEPRENWTLTEALRGAVRLEEAVHVHEQTCLAMTLLLQGRALLAVLLLAAHRTQSTRYYKWEDQI